MAANDLVTLSEVKAALHETGSDADTALTALITQVSEAIRTFTDRDFGATAVVETRTFRYSGGGYMDIDDCTVIHAVRMDGRALALGRDYRPQRERRGGPYYFLEILADPRRTGSPEMGFTRNEDTYSGPRSTPRSASVEVDAEFGYSPVPDDVKLAAIEMIRAAADLDSQKLQAENIAEYGYSNAVSAYNPGRWPSRAADILRPYRRVNM